MYDDYSDEFSFSRPYISAGESVLWRGKPGTGHLFTAQDVFLIPFSILWCGFAIFWETSVIAEGAPFFFALFGIPFVCVGLYITVGRFFWTAWIRRRTFYVITNQKIIRARGNRIDMIDGKTMPPVHVFAFKDGSGTIRFGEPYYYRRGRRVYRGDYNGWAPDSGLLSLENIPDVARVHQIISGMDR